VEHERLPWNWQQQGVKRLLLVARDRQRLAEVATLIEALGGSRDLAFGFDTTGE